MEKKLVEQDGCVVAVITSDEVVIRDAQDALDLMVTVGYEDGCDRIAITKEAIAEDFFDLRTGLAGEVLQKFVNYQQKLAIIGDFSSYESKALTDLIRESNKGHDAFFVTTEAEAIEKLSHVQ